MKSDLDASVQSKIDAQDNLAQNAEDATVTLVTDLLNRITTEKTSLLNRLSDSTNTHLSDSEDYLTDQVSSARLYPFNLLKIQITQKWFFDSSEINKNFDAAKKNISEEIEAGKSNSLAQARFTIRFFLFGPDKQTPLNQQVKEYFKNIIKYYKKSKMLNNYFEMNT